MTQLDLFYRAFGEFRKAFQNDRESSMLRDAIVQADEQDRVVVVKTSCQIEEDWIDAIERGLVFIGKAIEEDRQFIRSNGEVQDIEKVKQVSRESVEHLARHSNFITHEPKGEDILPDKLYTVERLNDYKIYENRFLYMLLCQLKDFVSLRYNQIIKLTNTYHGNVTMRKSVTEGKHRLQYEVNFKESREDDWYLRKNNSAAELLNRLELIQRSLIYYLRTPLMTEVAKADKLKPPITKTNILRMDKNFKEVVALYDFLNSYNKDGYNVLKEEKALTPLDDKIASELADPILLLSFIAYEHGLGLEDYLKQEFEKEEERREDEKKRLLREQLENLRNRIKSSGGNPEEYMLLLERRNRELEKDSEQLHLAREEIINLNAENTALQEQISACKAEIDQLNETHANEIADLNNQIEELNKKQAEEAAAHAAALVQAEMEKREEIACLKNEHESFVRENDARFAEKNRELDGLREEMKDLKKGEALLNARLTALRKEYGLLTETDDYTSEEAFEELEYQYEVFSEFFRGEWKDAKKLLRQDFFISLKKSFNDKIHKKKHKVANEGKEDIPEEIEADCGTAENSSYDTEGTDNGDTHE